MAKNTYMRGPSGEVFSTSNTEWHGECEDLGSGQKGYAAHQDYTRVLLRKMIKPKQTVYTVCRSVSKSGMSREISLFIIEKGQLRCIDSLVSDACGVSMGKHGLRVSGCGMDMGFHIVYNLGCALWPNGTRKPHGTRNGAPDSAGGYALTHSSI